MPQSDEERRGWPCHKPYCVCSVEFVIFKGPVNLRLFSYKLIGEVMAPQDTVFKIKYGDAILRIRAGLSYEYGLRKSHMTFQMLEDTIRRKLKIPETTELNLVYTDIEGDEVTLAGGLDIQDAVIHQQLDPVRVTVLTQEPHRPAHDGCPPLASDLAAEIILKLDQLLLAVNKKPVEPEVESVTNTESAKIEHRVLEGVDASTIADSRIKTAEDLFPAEEWTDIAQSGYDSEFLKRATILRQRGIADEVDG